MNIFIEQSSITTSAEPISSTMNITSTVVTSSTSTTTTSTIVSNQSNCYYEIK